MNGARPVASCTLSPAGAVTTVPFGNKCKVSYEFDTTATKPELALPYVVTVNDQVLPEFAEQPGALSKSNRKISLVLDPGSRVALFLNSDVHPRHRRHPVYALTVGNNDVLVKITERTGRIGHEWSRLRSPSCHPAATPGKLLDHYQAALTGDIWMEISHVYSPAEAEELMPDDTHPLIRDTVQRIYAGLTQPELALKFPASDSGPALTLKVKFLEEMQANVLANTTYCSWLNGILPRTHPCTFAALLAEAHAAGITELRITSGWRPCVGSIVHRAGLGLDINYAEGDARKLALNRASLTRAGAQRNGNVSEREAAAYARYAEADKDAEKSAQHQEEIAKQLAHSSGPAERERLQRELGKAKTEAINCKQIRDDRMNDWVDELKRNEPSLIQNLRQKLSKNKLVSQVFDPWYMDGNTRDAMPPVPNAQFSPNEKLHANHLHLTIRDPKILP